MDEKHEIQEPKAMSWAKTELIEAHELTAYSLVDSLFTTKPKRIVPDSLVLLKLCYHDWRRHGIHGLRTYGEASEPWTAAASRGRVEDDQRRWRRRGRASEERFTIPTPVEQALLYDSSCF